MRFISKPRESTARLVPGRLSSGAIVIWIRLRIVLTDIGIDQQRLLGEARSTRGLGEKSAIEVPERFLRSNLGAEALLLFENSNVQERRAFVDERVSLISSGDFLRELERAGMLQSPDCILDQASALGRNVERQRVASKGGTTRGRLRAQLQQRGNVGMEG